MTGEERDRRDSRALEPELITDPQAKAVAEARNGFRQYDAAIGTIHSALDRGSFKLRPSLILGLQREALAGISSYAGNYRPGGVAIEGSKHEPAGAHLVPELIEGSYRRIILPKAVPCFSYGFRLRVCHFLSLASLSASRSTISRVISSFSKCVLP